MKRLFYSLLMASVLVGCESQKPKLVKLYPGPERALQDLAVISVREPAPGDPEGRDGPVWIRELDGKSCYAGTVSVLPGTHVFSLMYTKRIRTREGSVVVQNRGYVRCPIPAQANHVYLFHSRVSDEDHLMYFPMDVTGQVTLSPQGTLIFPEEFSKHWTDRVKWADDVKEQSIFRR